MFDEVRGRVRDELQGLEIDACLVTTPANIFYTTGFFSPVVNLSFRLMGTDMALVPADPATPPAVMTSDFAAPAARAASSIEDIRTYRMWVENRDLDVITGPTASDARISRPPQWNPDELDETVASMLEDRGLSAATIGIDLRYVYADTLFRLQQKLRCTATRPDCSRRDCSGQLPMRGRARAPKTSSTFTRPAPWRAQWVIRHWASFNLPMGSSARVRAAVSATGQDFIPEISSSSTAAWQ